MGDTVRAVAIVNHGVWMARCPRPFCTNAERHGRDPKTGHAGGLDGATFRCSNCGLTCQSEWPEAVDDITWLLSLRPVPATRNWEPPETVLDLLIQNTDHGITPVPVEDAKGYPRALISVADGRIVAGRDLMPANRAALLGRL